MTTNWDDELLALDEAVSAAVPGCRVAHIFEGEDGRFVYSRIQCGEKWRFVAVLAGVGDEAMRRQVIESASEMMRCEGLSTSDPPAMPGFMKYEASPVYRVPGAISTMTIAFTTVDPMLPLRNLADAVALPAALLWLRGEWTARTGGAGTVSWDMRQWGAETDGAWLTFRAGTFTHAVAIFADGAMCAETECNCAIDEAWLAYGEHLAAQHRRGAR